MATAPEVDLSTLTGIEVLRLMPHYRELMPNIGAFLGIHTDKVEMGEVAMSMTTRPEFSNPLGTLHGGICATLLDSVMGCAVHSMLPAGASYTTLEIKINYIRSVPLSGEKLSATGSTIHVGGKTATAQGSIVDDQGRLVAHGSTTCMVFRPKTPNPAAETKSEHGSDGEI